MSWQIDPHDGAIVVTMASNSVNKMNPAFFDEMHEALDRIDRDYPHVPMVLTGQGRTFSAGLDFDQVFPLFASGDRDAILRWFARFRDCIVRLFALPRRVVAAVNGNAYAGGLILALCCEHRIGVAGRGHYTLNEVVVGIPMPSVYIEIVRHAVGTRVAAELMLDCRLFNAEEAQTNGFLQRLVPEADLLPAAVSQARIVGPDTYSAYRVSKASLIAPTLSLIKNATHGIDEAALNALMQADAQRAHAAAFRKLKAKT